MSNYPQEFKNSVLKISLQKHLPDLRSRFQAHDTQHSLSITQDSFYSVLLDATNLSKSEVATLALNLKDQSNPLNIKYDGFLNQLELCLRNQRLTFDWLVFQRRKLDKTEMDEIQFFNQISESRPKISQQDLEKELIHYDPTKSIVNYPYLLLQMSQMTSQTSVSQEQFSLYFRTFVDDFYYIDCRKQLWSDEYLLKIPSVVNSLGSRDVFEFFKQKGLSKLNFMQNRSVLIENLKQLLADSYKSKTEAQKSKIDEKLANYLFDESIGKYSIDKLQAMINHIEQYKEFQQKELKRLLAKETSSIFHPSHKELKLVLEAIAQYSLSSKKNLQEQFAIKDPQNKRFLPFEQFKNVLLDNGFNLLDQEFSQMTEFYKSSGSLNNPKMVKIDYQKFCQDLVLLDSKYAKWAQPFQKKSEKQWLDSIVSYILENYFLIDNWCALINQENKSRKCVSKKDIIKGFSDVILKIIQVQNPDVQSISPIVSKDELARIYLLLDHFNKASLFYYQIEEGMKAYMDPFMTKIVSKLTHYEDESLGTVIQKEQMLTQSKEILVKDLTSVVQVKAMVSENELASLLSYFGLKPNYRKAIKFDQFVQKFHDYCQTHKISDTETVDLVFKVRLQGCSEYEEEAIALLGELKLQKKLFFPSKISEFFYEIDDNKSDQMTAAEFEKYLKCLELDPISKIAFTDNSSKVSSKEFKTIAEKPHCQQIFQAMFDQIDKEKSDRVTLMKFYNFFVNNYQSYDQTLYLDTRSGYLEDTLLKINKGFLLAKKSLNEFITSDRILQSKFEELVNEHCKDDNVIAQEELQKIADLLNYVEPNDNLKTQFLMKNVLFILKKYEAQAKEALGEHFEALIIESSEAKLKAIKTRVAEKKYALARLFDKVDAKSDDDQFDFKQFMFFLNHLGTSLEEQVSLHEGECLFKQCNTQNNEKITLLEFSTFLGKDSEALKTQRDDYKILKEKIPSENVEKVLTQLNRQFTETQISAPFILKFDRETTTKQDLEDSMMGVGFHYHENSVFEEFITDITLTENQEINLILLEIYLEKNAKKLKESLGQQVQKEEQVKHFRDFDITTHCEQILREISERFDNNIPIILNFFDLDKSGSVNKEEFERSCKFLFSNRAVPVIQKDFETIQSCAKLQGEANIPNRIIQEMLEAIFGNFQQMQSAVLDDMSQNHQNPNSEDIPKEQIVYHRIRQGLNNNSEVLIKAFQEMDQADNKELHKFYIFNKIKQLGIVLSQEEKDQLAKEVESDGDMLYYADLICRIFPDLQKSQSSNLVRNLQDLVQIFHLEMTQQRLFSYQYFQTQLIDKLGSQQKVVTQQGLKKLLMRRGYMVTGELIQNLFMSMDFDKDLKINYCDFKVSLDKELRIDQELLKNMIVIELTSQKSMTKATFKEKLINYLKQTENYDKSKTDLPEFLDAKTFLSFFQVELQSTYNTNQLEEIYFLRTQALSQYTQENSDPLGPQRCKSNQLLDYLFGSDNQDKEESTFKKNQEINLNLTDFRKLYYGKMIKEKKSCQQVFQEFDSNRHNRLQLRQFKELCENLYQTQQKEVLPQNKISDLFDLFDRDKDMFVNYIEFQQVFDEQSCQSFYPQIQEFKTRLQETLKTQQIGLKAFIRKSDFDGDQKNSMEEFKAMRESIGMKTDLTEEEEKFLFAALDKNNDGFLSYYDLKESLNSSVNNPQLDVIVLIDLLKSSFRNYEPTKFLRTDQLEKLFEELDQTKSQKLSFYQFSQVLTKVGIQNLSVFDIEDVFRYLDTQQIDQIDKEDFVTTFEESLTNQQNYQSSQSTQNKRKQSQLATIKPGVFNPKFFQGEPEAQKQYYQERYKVFDQITVHEQEQKNNSSQPAQQEQFSFSHFRQAQPEAATNSQPQKAPPQTKIEPQKEQQGQQTQEKKVEEVSKPQQEQIEELELPLNIVEEYFIKLKQTMENNSTNSYHEVVTMFDMRKTGGLDGKSFSQLTRFITSIISAKDELKLFKEIGNVNIPIQQHKEISLVTSQQMTDYFTLFLDKLHKSRDMKNIPLTIQQRALQQKIEENTRTFMLSNNIPTLHQLFTLNSSTVGQVSIPRMTYSQFSALINRTTDLLQITDTKRFFRELDINNTEYLTSEEFQDFFPEIKKKEELEGYLQVKQLTCERLEQMNIHPYKLKLEFEQKSEEFSEKQKISKENFKKVFLDLEIFSINETEKIDLIFQQLQKKEKLESQNQNSSKQESTIQERKDLIKIASFFDDFIKDKSLLTEASMLNQTKNLTVSQNLSQKGRPVKFLIQEFKKAILRDAEQKKISVVEIYDQLSFNLQNQSLQQTRYNPHQSQNLSSVNNKVWTLSDMSEILNKLRLINWQEIEKEDIFVWIDRDRDDVITKEEFVYELFPERKADYHKREYSYLQQPFQKIYDKLAQKNELNLQSFFRTSYGETPFLEFQKGMSVLDVDPKGQQFQQISTKFVSQSNSQNIDLRKLDEVIQDIVIKQSPLSNSNQNNGNAVNNGQTSRSDSNNQMAYQQHQKRFKPEERRVITKVLANIKKFMDEDHYIFYDVFGKYDHSKKGYIDRVDLDRAIQDDLRINSSTEIDLFIDYYVDPTRNMANLAKLKYDIENLYAQRMMSALHLAMNPQRAQLNTMPKEKLCSFNPPGKSIEEKNRVNTLFSKIKSFYRDNRSLMNRELFEHFLKSSPAGSTHKISKASFIEEIKGTMRDQAIERDVIESYNYLDKNRQGYIGLCEFRYAFYDLSFLVQELTQSQITSTLDADLKQVFDRVDDDRSNTIDLGEFVNCMRLLGYCISPDLIRSHFNDYDLNGNGKIDFQEFKELMKKKLGQEFFFINNHIQQFKTAFRSVVPDGNFFDFSQFVEALKKLKIDLSYEEQMAVFMEADVDGIGQANIDDFIFLMIKDPSKFEKQETISGLLALRRYGKLSPIDTLNLYKLLPQHFCMSFSSLLWDKLQNLPSSQSYPKLSRSGLSFKGVQGLYLDKENIEHPIMPIPGNFIRCLTILKANNIPIPNRNNIDWQQEIVARELRVNLLDRNSNSYKKNTLVIPAQWSDRAPGVWNFNGSLQTKNKATLANQFYLRIHNFDKEKHRNYFLTFEFVTFIKRKGDSTQLSSKQSAQPNQDKNQKQGNSSKSHNNANVNLQASNVIALTTCWAERSINELLYNEDLVLTLQGGNPLATQSVFQEEVQRLKIDMSIRVQQQDKISQKNLQTLSYLPPSVLIKQNDLELTKYYRFYLGENSERVYNQLNTSLPTDMVVRSFLRLQNQTDAWERVTQFWNDSMVPMFAKLPNNLEKHPKEMQSFNNMMNQIYIMFENIDYQMHDSTDQKFGDVQLLHVRSQLLERALANALSQSSGGNKEQSMTLEGINKALDLNEDLDDEFDPFDEL